VEGVGGGPRWCRPWQLGWLHSLMSQGGGELDFDPTQCPKPSCSTASSLLPRVNGSPPSQVTQNKGLLLPPAPSLREFVQMPLLFVKTPSEIWLKALSYFTSGHFKAGFYRLPLRSFIIHHGSFKQITVYKDAFF